MITRAKAAPAQKPLHRPRRITSLPVMAETPQKAFRPQILVALYQLGGSASKRATIRRIEELYGSRLTEEDWLPCKTRPEPKWQNLVAWERKDLIEDGLLDSTIETPPTLRCSASAAGLAVRSRAELRRSRTSGTDRPDPLPDHRGLKRRTTRRELRPLPKGWNWPVSS